MGSDNNKRSSYHVLVLHQKTPAAAWNRGKLVGQKPPLKLKDVWSIRTRLEMEGRLRDLALFSLAIDSKLRACDLLKLRVRDVLNGDRVAARTTVMQQKTRQPVQFEITSHAQSAVNDWIRCAQLTSENYLFPNRLCAHISTRQYTRLVAGWVSDIGLDSRMYGTHSLRRTKVSLIYRRTQNLRAIQLLLGHTKLESTVRYLGIEIDDALEMAEKTEL